MKMKAAGACNARRTGYEKQNECKPEKNVED